MAWTLIAALDAARLFQERQGTMALKLKALGTMLALAAQTAIAAPIGWYDVALNWRDGAFSGQILYDGSSPFQVLEINGSLTTTAQVTAIRDVWNVSHGQPVSEEFPLNFTNRSDPSDSDNYNASFYLELADLGSELAVIADPGSAFGLYDWSNPDMDNEAQLSNSPLLSWRIAQVNQVPEPSTMLLVLFGLSICALQRRARPAP